MTKQSLRIYLDATQFAYLRELAQANGCSLSQAIRMLLIEHARRNAE